jgi:hypothetical protein
MVQKTSRNRAQKSFKNMVRKRFRRWLKRLLGRSPTKEKAKAYIFRYPKGV